MRHAPRLLCHADRQPVTSAGEEAASSGGGLGMLWYDDDMLSE